MEFFWKIGYTSEEDENICAVYTTEGEEKFMKKLLVLLCTGMLAFSLAACGGKDDAGKESTQETAAESTAQESSQAGEQTQPEGTAEGTQGAVQEPSGQGEGTSWSEEMAAIKQAIVDEIGENYWPTMALTPEMLEGSFGLTSDMYEDYLGEMPMISTNVDTLLIIKAKSDKVSEVEEALNAYREALVNDTMQYPMNLGKIQASKVETIGNYVCFVQLGADTLEAMESGDEAVIAHCQEQNNLVIEVIRQNVEK